MPPKGRSIEEQRARLLNQNKPRSKTNEYSTKYIKKEVVNIQYGLKKNKPVSTRKLNFLYPAILSGTVLIGVLFLSNFFNALLCMVFSFFLFFVLFNYLKQVVIPEKTVLELDYNINYIFETYHDIFNKPIREKLMSIKNTLSLIKPSEIDLAYQHYLRSTTQKDLPELFSHYKILFNNKSEKLPTVEKEILEQLDKIQGKINVILNEKENLVEDKIKVKAKVIEQKAQL